MKTRFAAAPPEVVPVITIPLYEQRAALRHTREGDLWGDKRAIFEIAHVGYIAGAT